MQKLASSPILFSLSLKLQNFDNIIKTWHMLHFPIYVTNTYLQDSIFSRVFAIFFHWSCQSCSNKHSTLEDSSFRLKEFRFVILILFIGILILEINFSYYKKTFYIYPSLRLFINSFFITESSCYVSSSSISATSSYQGKNTLMKIGKMRSYLVNLSFPPDYSNVLWLQSFKGPLSEKAS